jgi:hypothetical protein
MAEPARLAPTGTGRPRQAGGGRRGGGAWLLAGLSLLLAGGLWLWFDANYERRLQEVQVDASPAARRNPFLAAERFLTRVGIDARSVAGLELLRHPPDAGDMLVIAGLPPLDAARQGKLRAWLEAGGHLLVEAVHEHPPDTPPRPEVFLDRFGAALRQLEYVRSAAVAVAKLAVPGHPEPLRVGFHPHWYLEDLSGEAQARALADGKARLLQYRVGDGLLYVVSDSLWLGNEAIGEYDHALLLAVLAADRGTVWLLHDVSMPGLAVLLWRAAPAAILSAALLLALWLWHLGARLGPLLPPPAAGRRDLLEHLQAAGDFLWRLGRGGALVQQTRRRIERHWLQRHPPLQALDQAGRAARIAELSGLGHAAVHAALYAPVGDAARLVTITRTLQCLARQRPRGAQPHPRTGPQRQAGS